MTDHLPPETRRRVREFMAAFESEILMVLSQGSKCMRSIRATAKVEGHQLRKDSTIEPAPHFPVDGGEG